MMVGVHDTALKPHHACRKVHQHAFLGVTEIGEFGMMVLMGPATKT